MNCLATFLRGIGHLTPAWLPRGTAVGNRLLKPLYRLIYGSNWQSVEVWPQIRMKINPTECVGGNLFFSPHLYDISERAWIERYLPENGTFLDVGANLGVYSLWAAKFLSSEGKILAIEADRDTFQMLKVNLAMNTYQCAIVTENIGVSDKFEELQFYKNTHGNSGANSFHTVQDSEPSGTLKLAPLISLLKKNEIQSIDFLKIDIEGFELKVLNGFFSECLQHSNACLKPKYVMIEIEEGPRSLDLEYKKAIRNMFALNGYEVAFDGKNTLYKLIINE